MTDPSTPPPPPVYPPFPPPPLTEVPPVTRAPRRWLGRKGALLIVAGGTMLWFGIVLFEVLLFHVNQAPTNALLIGAFTVSSAFVYTMAYRLRPSDELGVTRLLLAFLVGGLLATTLAGPVDALVGLWSGGTRLQPSVVALSLAGVIEELAKILLVLLFSVGLARKNVRNGLFLGGAVGFGFAAFEDVVYARGAWNSAYAAHVSALPPEIWNVISRDVLGIFGHPLYTALLAAAVFAAVRNGRFRFSIRIVLVYLGVAAAHGLFDAIGDLVFDLTHNGIVARAAFFALAVVEAVGFALIWRYVSRRASRAAQLTVRHATADDLPFLITMMAEAANWDGKRSTTLAGVQQDPLVWHYLEGWQRPTDFGLVALDGGVRIGATWARFLTTKDAGYGYVSDSIPELTLAVATGARRRGVGKLLLDGLIESARELELDGLSLSVEDGNTAARALYERAGFVMVGRNGDSDTMLLRLST